MYFLNAGTALPAAATSMVELVQKAMAQHLAFLTRGTELSQKFVAKSLQANTGPGWVESALECFADVQKLATDVVSAQAAFAGEIAQVGCQSLLQALSAPSSDKREKSVGGGEFAEAQERSAEAVETVKAMAETTVVPAKPRRKSRPKKA